MQLIIAEKPSLGKNIAAGIGDFRRRDGYLEGDGCIITWVFGHLFSLADIEYYNPRPEGVKWWTMDNIPCFPDAFHYELREADSGILKQYKTIETLYNSADNKESRFAFGTALETLPFRKFQYEDFTKNTAKASTCKKCGACEEVCPQRLPIKKLISNLAWIYEKK